MGHGALRQEALRDSLPEFYASAVREHEVDVIAAPEIDITEGQEDVGFFADLDSEAADVLCLGSITQQNANGKIDRIALPAARIGGRLHGDCPCRFAYQSDDKFGIGLLQITEVP